MSTVNLLFRAREPDAKNPDGGYIPVSSLNPLPVTGAAFALVREGSFAGNYARIEPNGHVELGRLGAYLTSLLVIPLAGVVGAIEIGDGATSFTIFNGGSLADRRPFKIDIGAYSRDGPWSVTTGKEIAVLATGEF